MTHHWPTLTTRRTLLRPLVDGDCEFVYSHFRDPDVGRYLVDHEPPASLEEAMDIIEWSRMEPDDPKQNRWAIVTTVAEGPIGTCGFHKWDKRNHLAEIGFDLGRAFWRMGYMSEILPTVLAYGFDSLGLNRVEALVHTDNEASCGLLRGLGFHREGTLRARFLAGGCYHDHELFSLLRAPGSGAP